MTTRDTTGLLAKTDSFKTALTQRALVAAWATIQWPWLLRSLWGGRKADKAALLHRLDLPGDALPNLGSWKADTVLLAHIVAAVEELRPREAVELGCGASSLVLARALQRNGGGRMTSFDQHGDFVAATRVWLAEHGLHAEMHEAPLVADPSRWGPVWYDLTHLPATIDLLVIDGPPWAINPFVRGRAEVLFARIPPGGIVLLDDAARPGERVVARRWRQTWPEFAWIFDATGTKGTLTGRRRG